MEINFKKWLNEDMGGLINPNSSVSNGSIKPIGSVPVKSMPVQQGTTPKPNDILTPLIKQAATEYKSNIGANIDVNKAAMQNPKGTFNILRKFQPKLGNNEKEVLKIMNSLTSGVQK